MIYDDMCIDVLKKAAIYCREAPGRHESNSRSKSGCHASSASRVPGANLSEAEKPLLETSAARKAWAIWPCLARFEAIEVSIKTLDIRSQVSSLTSKLRGPFELEQRKVLLLLEGPRNVNNQEIK